MHMLGRAARQYMFPSYFQDILCPAHKAMAEDEKTPSATSAGAATPVLTLRG